jgi:hypothetical protein
VVTTNGGSLVVNSGTLNGVTLDGTLDVGNSVEGASLTVTNGLTLNGTMLVGNPGNGWWGAVYFAGSQVLGGNGTVVFGNHGYANSLLMVNGGTTLVLGSGIRVHGQNGSIGYNIYEEWGSTTANVVNQGTIAADVSGRTITLAGGSFGNAGTLAARNGGQLSVLDMAGQVGQVSLGGGSTLSLNGAYTNDLVLNVPTNAVLNVVTRLGAPV